MSTLILKVCFLLSVIVSVGRADEWAKTVDSSKDGEKTTTMQFYFHDIQSGKTPSVVPIAHTANPHKYSTGFGDLFMADDKLTVGPDPGSKLVGHAQGLYGSAAQDELGYIMAMSYTFSDGVYNGSTFSISGMNEVMHRPQREMPVVGGTGLFRMARGYAIVHTPWVDFKLGDAIVGYNGLPFSILN